MVAVLFVDALLIPGVLLGRWLVAVMYTVGEPCPWAAVGAQCATCGGTHCVESFLRFDFSGAFFHNPMVFGWILYAILTLVLLNVGFVLRCAWASRWLRGMYSLTAFFIGLGIYLGFTLVRNIPFLLNLIS